MLFHLNSAHTGIRDYALCRHIMLHHLNDISICNFARYEIKCVDGVCLATQLVTHGVKYDGTTIVIGLSLTR